ncbi:hypothetical protein B0H17DRAFT_1211677 [Mycena rosella]|uniref:Uncharacterized protein n=1 Tax=Mycena rosella TaxID=1033263 RepID=A0AAD7CR83_MYCRO|nr:hypothetical protein B0H17DRAFT_1145113 [Mycena rosella]KAJ7663502.1 hypothetical protein B0H17DRAFT_1211677 [Mycena rosella]
MSSRANSPPDDLDDVYAAMTQSSPVRPSAANTGDKTPRSPADDDQSDTEETPATIAVSGSATNQNFVASVNRFMAKKRLRGEQKAEVADWLNDLPTLREAKAFVQAFHLENLITKVIVSQPPWAVSSDLETNIYSYGASILLSTKLSAYKGSVPKQILYGILKKHRFDLPPGIEHNPANWRKVTHGVEEALTQLRAKFKKAIGGSLKEKTKDKTFFPNADRKDIYQLTQDIAQGTQCEVNILLCARVAFMRKSYIKDSTVGFWNTVDADLVKIRSKAGGDPKKVAKAFRHILQADRKEHGVDDYEIEDAVDTFQQDVDKIVEAGIAAQPGPAEGEGDDDE